MAWKTQPVGELLKWISMSVPDLHSVSSQSQQREEKEGWAMETPREGECYGYCTSDIHLNLCALRVHRVHLNSRAPRVHRVHLNSRALKVHSSSQLVCSESSQSSSQLACSEGSQSSSQFTCSEGSQSSSQLTCSESSQSLQTAVVDMLSVFPVQFSSSSRRIPQICWICDSHWETNCYTFSLVYKTTTISTTLSHLMNIMQAQNRKLTDCGGQCEGNCFLKSNTSQSCFIMSDHLSSVCFSWISENKDAPIV